MGQDISRPLHRPDWLPAVNVADTIAGGNWGVSAAAAVAIPDDLSPALAADWQRGGGVPYHLAVAQDEAGGILAGVDDPETMIAGFDGLPQGVRDTIIAELALGSTGAVRIASDAEIAEFSALGGKQLVQHWRGAAPRKVAICTTRFVRWLDSLDSVSAADREAAYNWWDSLSLAQFNAVMMRLAR